MPRSDLKERFPGILSGLTLDDKSSLRKIQRLNSKRLGKKIDAIRANHDVIVNQRLTEADFSEYYNAILSSGQKMTNALQSFEEYYLGKLRRNEFKTVHEVMVDFYTDGKKRRNNRDEHILDREERGHMIRHLTAVIIAERRARKKR